MTSTTHPLPLAAALAAALFVAGCGGGSADNLSGSASAQACSAFMGTTIAGATIAKTELFPAGASSPEYCQLSAMIAPKLVFQIRLPSQWNHKLHYSGGGGYNGVVPDADLVALGQGYVDVSSDSGHQESPYTANFAIADAQARELFGYLSVPTVMNAALAIVQTRYQSAATHSYFEGCSGGGREALMSAQRYPQLFDGIIARAPAYNWAGLMGAMHRNAQAVALPGARLNAQKTALLSNAVLAQCDALDGIADGVVSNPQACTFDPAALRCPNGADTGNACLSDAQLGVVASWTGAASFANDRYRNPGWPLSGNETQPGAWDLWLLGATVNDPSLQFIFADATVKGYLAKDANADSLRYVYDSNPTALGAMAALNDATDVDLRPFKAAGGKLILWHGLGDAAISPKGTEAYYQGMVNAVGGQASADAFARLYLAPGVNHCDGGPGADHSDLLSALDAWVDQGTAPADLQASRVAGSGATVLTRPLCRYPAYPRYDGRGDPKLAQSYRCTPP